MLLTKTEESLLALVGSGETVVDCGCGSGKILTALEGKFTNLIGLDSHLRVDEQKRNSKGNLFREVDLNQRFPLPDSYADVVIANQVIEHLVNPYHFARETFRLLKKGGRCVLTTPNIRYVKSLAKLVFSGYGPRTACENTLDGEWDDGHLHYFTHRDLRQLFTDVGFRQVHSYAHIDVDKRSILRRFLMSRRSSWLVREFLSGSIVLCGIK